VGSSFQQNIGLDKQFFKGTYQFDWQPNGAKKIQIKLLDLEFVNNQNVTNYFNVYKNSYDRLNTISQSYNFETSWVDENNNLTIPDGASNFINAVLENQTLLEIDDNEFKLVNTAKERQARLTSNNLILASSINLNLNSQESIFDENFYQFRWKTTLAGNLLNKIISSMRGPKNDQGQNLLGGLSPSHAFIAECLNEYSVMSLLIEELTFLKRLQTPLK
jgi:hypothetical protein